MGRVRTVLSIDGFGFRGYVQLRVLEYLMQDMEEAQTHPQPETEPLRPCQVFDLICGTGMGGLIAILLGRLGLTCKQALEEYKKLEDSLFADVADSQGTGFEVLRRIVRQGVNLPTESFQNALTALISSRLGGIGDKLVMREANDFDFENPGRERTRTLVTVVEKDATSDVDATRIRSYRSRNIDTNTHPWTILHAALGTSNCPAFLPAMEVSDGLIVQAAHASGFSNPSMIAYIESLNEFGPETELALVSLGMGLRNRNTVLIQQPVVSSDDILHPLLTQTFLVATSTELKHSRVADRMRRASQHNYIRLDPPGDSRPLVLVDYWQRSDADAIIDRFAKNGRSEISQAKAFLIAARADPWQWVKVEGYAIDYTDRPHLFSLPEVDFDTSTSDMMVKCYQWERENPGQFVALFTDEGFASSTFLRLVHTCNETLYVRVHINNQWDFHPRQNVHTLPVSDSEDTGDKFSILTNLRNKSIVAFNSKGLVTSNPEVRSEGRCSAHEYFTQDYEGLWIRKET